ncbi:MAG: hypothetical protein SFW64_00160 [Alphaproteobacteria bacterium]|nr:hypothetical protein [Alphaproteobacteria bacterium]
MAETDDSELDDAEMWIRSESLRAAVRAKSHLPTEKIIETAMVFEWYLRGEIPPEGMSKEFH